MSADDFNPLSDHIHPLGQDDFKAVPVVSFTYPDDGEAHSDDTVTVADATSALSQIIDWLCVPTTANMCAARALSLQLWVRPTHSRFRSLLKIADSCDVSRAALSKALLRFRDEYAVKLTIGRLESSREIFRQAALASVAAGTHVHCREKNVTIPHSGDSMDPQKVNTLDKARTEIERLESELVKVKQPKPATAAHDSVSLPTPSKPVATLEEQPLEVIKQALELSQHTGNKEAFEKILREYKRRRGF